MMRKSLDIRGWKQRKKLVLEWEAGAGNRKSRPWMMQWAGFWIAKNPAKGLKAPREIRIAVKPYDESEIEKIAWAIPLFPIKGIYGEECFADLSMHFQSSIKL